MGFSRKERRKKMTACSLVADLNINLIKENDKMEIDSISILSLTDMFPKLFLLGNIVHDLTLTKFTMVIASRERRVNSDGAAVFIVFSFLMESGGGTENWLGWLCFYVLLASTFGLGNLFLLGCP